MQPWEFIVVEKKELLEKLSEIHRWAKPISLAAHALGLGQFGYRPLETLKEMQEILNIPSSKKPIAIIAMD